jgi:hypothetical protein
MLNQFKLAVTCEAFKGFVGRQIFCKGCESILDCSRAVEFSFKKGDTYVSLLIFCGKCVEKDKMQSSILNTCKDLDLTLEIFDGRAINWKRGCAIRKGQNPEILSGWTLENEVQS